MKKLAEKNGWILYTDVTADDEKATYLPYKPLTKEIFDECPFKEYIFQNQTVMFILPLGSGLLGITDAYSDYDLAVFVTKPYTPKVHYVLGYNGRFMHWYYKTIDKLIEPEDEKLLTFYGLFQYKYLYDDLPVYLDTQYKDYWQFILANKDLISKISAKSMFLPMYFLIELLLNIKSPFDKKLSNLPLKAYSKALSVYYSINNEPIDIQFVLRVKKMRFVPLTMPEFERLKATLRAFIKLLESDKDDIKKLADEWNANVKSLKLKQ